MVIRELFVKLGLDFDSAGFAEGNLAADGLKKGLEKVKDAAVAVAKFLLGTVTGTVAAAGALDDLSKSTQTSTDTLQSLGYAFSQSGVGTEDFATSLKILSKQAYAAAQGSAEAKKSFTRMGVSLYGANGKLKSADELLLDVGDGLAKLPKGFEKTAIAATLLGRGGDKLLAVFDKGAGGVRKMQEEFVALGLGISSDTIDAGDRLGDSWETLGKIAESLKATFAGPIINDLNVLVDEFKAWYAVNKDLIKQKLEIWGARVGRVVTFLARTGAVLSKVVHGLVDNWRLFAAIAAGAAVVALKILIGLLAANLTQIIWVGAAYLHMGWTAALAAAKAAAAWIAVAAPMLILAAIVAFLLLAFEDVNGYLKGQDSLIGDIGPKWTAFLDDFTKVSGEDPWWLKAIKLGLKMLGDLETTWKGLTGKMSADNFFGGFLGLKKSDHGALWGGGASPMASAQAAVGAGTVLAPNNFNATITVNASPGQKPEEVANELVWGFQEWHSKKVQEALPVVGG